MSIMQNISPKGLKRRRPALDHAEGGGIQESVPEKNIYILDQELLVGGAAFKPRAGILCADSSCSILDRELDTISTRKFDPFIWTKKARGIFKEEVSDYWKNKCLLDRWQAMMPEKLRDLRDSGMIYIDRKAVRGYGETTPGWTELLSKGVGGFKREAEEKLAQLTGAHCGRSGKNLFPESRDHCRRRDHCTGEPPRGSG